MDLVKDVYVLVNKRGALVTAMGALQSAKTVYTNKKEALWDALNFDEKLKIKVIKSTLIIPLDT